LADELITIRADAQQASREIRDNAAAIDSVNKSLDENTAAAGASSEATGKVVEVSLAAAAAVLVLVAAIADSVKEFAEQDAANGRLVRSLGQAGASTDAFAKAQANATRNAQRYGISVLEQTDALRELIDAGADAEQAQEDLNLAIDIGAQTTDGLAKTTQILTKVRNGDIGPLKKLGVLTKDQIKDLGKVTDEAERTAIAMDILREKYEGAAEANAGLADAQGKTEEALKAVQVELGALVAELGDEGAGAIGALFDFITLSDDGTFSLQNFATGLRNFTASIREIKQPLEDLADVALGGGLIGQAIRGEELTFTPAQVLSAADTRRSAEAAAAKTPAAEGPAGPQLDKDTRIKIALEAQEEEKRIAKEAADAEKQRVKDAAEAEKKKTAAIAAGQAERQRLASEAEAEEQARFERQKAFRKRVQDDEKKAAAESAKLAKAKEKTEAEAAKKADARAKAIKAADKQQIADAAAVEAAKKAEQQANVATAVGGAEAAVSLATSFIENEQAKAVISAAIEGARAVAAGAAGNIPGAIAHGIAAVQFAAVAAKSVGKVSGKSAGGGGTPSGGAGAGAGAAAAASAGPPESQFASFQGQALAGGAGAGGGGTTVNLTLSSFTKPSPREARVAGRAVAREQQNMVGLQRRGRG